MYSVLIADDEQIERDFLRHVLTEYANRYVFIGEAENGSIAVELARALHPDIVLLDINMPLLGGLDAAKEIKAIAPNTIAILNSAYAEFDFAQKAIAYDVDAYLVKPAEKELIISTLDNCVQKRRILPPPSIVSLQSAKSYPYELADKLMHSVACLNGAALRENADAYYRFFEGSYADFAHYRLFIINTVFNIGRALHNSSIPDGAKGLLGEQATLEHICRAGTWFEVLLILKEFFVRLAMLLDSFRPGKENPVDAVAHYIDQHYEKKLALSELASMVYMSPAHLSRRFHQEKGIALHRYITTRRMEAAETLLGNSELSIDEIAEACGFSSQSYFHKVCKDFTGRTPAAIRRAVLRKE